MKNEEVDQIQEKIRKKFEKREKKKRPKMKISGKSVFQIKKLIKNKSEK